MDIKEQLKNIVMDYKKLSMERINMDKTPEEKPVVAAVEPEPEIKKKAELPVKEELVVSEPEPELEKPGVKKEQEVPGVSDLDKLTEIVEKLFEKIEAIEVKLASWEAEKAKAEPAAAPEKQIEPPMQPIQEHAHKKINIDLFDENRYKENNELLKAIKEVF